jgi:hypothetical protein
MTSGEMPAYSLFINIFAWAGVVITWRVILPGGSAAVVSPAKEVGIKTTTQKRKKVVHLIPPVIIK